MKILFRELPNTKCNYLLFKLDTLYPEKDFKFIMIQGESKPSSHSTTNIILNSFHHNFTKFWSSAVVTGWAYYIDITLCPHDDMLTALSTNYYNHPTFALYVYNICFIRAKFLSTKKYVRIVVDNIVLFKIILILIWRPYIHGNISSHQPI